MTDHPAASGSGAGLDGDAGQDVTAEQQAATWVPQPPQSALVTQDSAVIGPPEHPEYAVAGAFAGGLVAALIFRRFAR